MNLQDEIRSTVRNHWDLLVSEIRDPALRTEARDKLFDLEELSIRAALDPANALRLAPELAAVRSSLASLSAATAIRIRRANQLAAEEVAAIVVRYLTLAIAGA